MGRLDEIEARLKAATPQPWAVEIRNSGGSISDVEDFYGFDIQGPPEAMRGQFARGADADFVAHARTDVPAMLAVARAAAELVHGSMVPDDWFGARKRLISALAALDRSGEGRP